MDAGNPVAGFTVKHEPQICLSRKLDTFTSPVVYMFGEDMRRSFEGIGRWPRASFGDWSERPRRRARLLQRGGW
jgi:hypothetical protein